MFVRSLAFLSAKKIHGAVEADGVQPGSEGCGVLEPVGVEFFEGPDEGVLHDVFGIGIRSGVAEGDAPDSLPVAQIKPVVWSSFILVSISSSSFILWNASSSRGVYI